MNHADIAARPPGSTRINLWALVALGMLLASAAVYWPLAAQPGGTGLLGAWDVFTAYGPWLYFTDHRIHDGEFPLWDPLSMCGQPFAANPQTLLFYPPNLVRSALTFSPTPLRTHIGFAAMVVLHMLLGAAGVAALMRRLGIGWVGAVTAGIVLLGSSQFVERFVRHPVFVLTIAWLPWVLIALLTVLNAHDRARRYRGAVIAGLLFGVLALAGFPQLTIYCGIAMAAFFALRWVCTFRAVDASARASWPQLGLAFVVIGIIGAGIAAASYVPAQEFSELSARQKDRELAVEDYVANAYTPLRIFRSFLIYPGLAQSSLKITGTAALILALAAAWHPNRRLVLLFVALLYIFVDCAIGPPMPVAMLTALITPFRIVYPDYACFIAVLPLAMLAGLGVEALARCTDRFIKRLPVLAVALAVFWIAFAKVDDVEIQPSALAMVVAGLMCCVLGAAATRRFTYAPAFAATVLVVLESAVWTPAFIPHLIEKWGSPPFEIDALRDTHPFWDGASRGAHFAPNAHLYDMEAIINGYNPLFIEDTYQVVCPPGMEDRYTWWLQLEVVQQNPRGNLLLKRPFWLAREAVVGPLPPKNTPFPPTTTVFLEDAPGPDIPVVATPTRGQALSDQARMVSVFEKDALKSAMATPRVNEFGKLVVDYQFKNMHHPRKHAALRLVAGDGPRGTILASLTEHASGRRYFLLIQSIGGNTPEAELLLPDVETFDLELALLFDPAGPHGELDAMFLVADDADENGLVHINERDANSVRVKVGPLPEARMLVLTESFYPGWRASVDGQPAEIVRADDAFMAVALPPGEHEVVFAFRPRRVYVGIVVSGLTAVAAIAVLIGLFRASRKAL